MTPQEKEQFYDENVAPELAKLAKLCKEKGISFLAVAEYDPPQISQGVTILLEEKASLSMQMLRILALSLNNIDKFMFGLLKYLSVNEIDHGSIFLAPHLKPLASEREAPKQEEPKPGEKQVRIAFIN